jgi:hypothetical protein
LKIEEGRGGFSMIHRSTDSMVKLIPELSAPPDSLTLLFPPATIRSVSQLPPYMPPDPSAWGYFASNPEGQLLRPARRASWLMLILGGLLLAAGACCVGIGTLMPWDQMPPDSLAQMQQLEKQVGVSVPFLMTVFGVMTVVPGVVLLIVGFFVRSGGLGSIITGIVVTAIIILVLLVMLLSALERAASGQAGDAAMGLVFFTVLLAGFGLLLAWLVQAARQTGQLAALRQARQMQYWQAMQHQAAYQGYSPPSPPPPPPGAPPPPAAPPPPPGQPPVA